MTDTKKEPNMENEEMIFDLSVFSNSELLAIAYIIETNVDFLCLQLCTLLPEIDVKKHEQLKNTVYTSAFVIQLMEDELQKRGLLNEYRDNLFLDDYSDGGAYSYTSYVHRIQHLISDCLCGRIREDTITKTVKNHIDNDCADKDNFTDLNDGFGPENDTSDVDPSKLN